MTPPSQLKTFLRGLKYKRKSVLTYIVIIFYILTYSTFLCRAQVKKLKGTTIEFATLNVNHSCNITRRQLTVQITHANHESEM